MSDEGELAIEVQKVIDAHAATSEISPDWIATETMLAIRFARTFHRLGYAGCHLELRQIARGKLRRQFDPPIPTQRMKRRICSPTRCRTAIRAGANAGNRQAMYCGF
jgi:hypothetical protein